jgi:uncharacterized membrane protein YdbT with pleckstrin-like domain
MITLNQPHHLGIKALLLLLLRYVAIGVVFYIVAFVAYLFQNVLVVNAVQTFTIAGATTLSDPNMVAYYLSVGINGLFVLSLILMVIGAVVAYLQYHFYTYTLEEFNLILRRGVLNKEEVSIPYRQMQDININRSLFYVILGLSRLIIDSAGHEEKEEQNETDIILEPLDVTVAGDIRNFLKRRVGVQVVVDEKVADVESLELSKTDPELREPAATP